MRPFWRKVCLALVMTVALLLACVVTVVSMVKVHDQDVTVYSVTPAGKTPSHRPASSLVHPRLGRRIRRRPFWYNDRKRGCDPYGPQEDIGPGPEDCRASANPRLDVAGPGLGFRSLVGCARSSAGP